MPSEIIPVVERIGKLIFIIQPTAKKAPLAVAAALVLLFLSMAAPVRAQDEASGEGEEYLEDELEIDLDPIVVEGDAVISEREVENPTKFMTVIDTSDSSGRVDTVSDVLSDSVGVQVNQWGGLGSFATVSIRGSSPSQVQVYVDGIPLNRARTGIANIGDLPLEDVEYIEVFRGFTPADFGSSGIGGVVNLVTKSGKEKSAVTSASYGSYDTYKALASASGPVGPVSVMVFGEYMQSQGDYDYVNDNGTPLNASDDFEETRRNNDFASADLTLRVSGDAGNWKLDAVAMAHDKDQGLPGLQSMQAEHTRLETDRLSSTLSARNRGLLGGRFDLTLAADGFMEDQLYDDPYGEVGLGGPRRTENQMRTYGARAKSTIRLLEDDLILTGFTEYREETYQALDKLNGLDGRLQKRDLWTNVFQVEATEPTGFITVQAAVRNEQYWNDLEGDPFFVWSSQAGENKDYLNLTNPSVGLLARLTDDLRFKANAGQYHRVPTFYELFGDRGVAVGNTDLKPEKGVNWDVGLSYRGEGNEAVSDPFVEYAFFQSRVEDLILFFQNSQRTVRAMNIGEALIGGHEIAFGLRLYRNVKITGNYTLQSAVDLGEVDYYYYNALPHRPMHEAYGKVEVLAPNDPLKIWVDGSYISGNYWDRANLYEVEDRRIVNLGITCEIFRRDKRFIEVTLEAKNMTDDRVSDVAGYPLPGRSAFITLQAGL